jgi:hypothetical protein
MLFAAMHESVPGPVAAVDGPAVAPRASISALGVVAARVFRIDFRFIFRVAP